MKSLTNIAFILLVVTLSSATSKPASAQTRPEARKPNHVIYIESVEVTRNKASGHEWDNNLLLNAPDLRVEVMRRDSRVERRILLLERQEMLRRSQIMNEQSAKHAGERNRRFARMMNDPQFPFGNNGFADMNEMSAEMLAWQEVELNDPQLQKITEELAELRDQLISSTSVAQNTFKAEFGVQMGEPTIDVAVGETVKLTVWDDDIAANDLVGYTTLRITKAAIAKGSFDVTCGKVISLRFAIRTIE